MRRSRMAFIRAAGDALETSDLVSYILRSKLYTNRPVRRNAP
jgi:hypothetical protein